MAFVYPKITVITVSYNAAPTILQTIKGVFSQTYSNLEYIIIDGKSTDGTIEIIKKFQNKLGYWISEKDNGIYDAMNKGIKACTGNWIIFLGADDVFYNNNIVNKIFNTYKVTEYDFIYGDVIFKSNGKIIGGDRNYGKLIDRNIVHQSIFYKKQIFGKLQTFNLKYKILADYELNLRIFKDFSLKKLYIPEVISLFNNKGLSNVIIDELFFKDQLNYLICEEKMPSNSPLLQKYYFYYGFSRVFKGEWLSGLKNVFHALTSGKRKFYFFLLTGKFLLSKIGIGKKIKVC